MENENTDVFSATNGISEVKIEDKNYLEEFVGEGKKFKTVEDLAKAKAYSDEFINTLKREQEDLRAELNKRLTLEDFVTKMKESKTTEGSSMEHNQSSQNDTTSLNTRDVNATVDFDALLESKLKERELQSQKQRNKQLSNDKLVSTWGNEAANNLNIKAKELGVTVQELQSYAENNPNVFFKLIGLDEQRIQQNKFSLPSGGTDSTKMSLGNASNQKDYKYYDKLRKENPREYFSADVQKEMHKSAMALGSAFYN